jgi:predicted GNAT family acetyltransferase
VNGHGPTPPVVHNATGARFELVVEGQTAHLDYQIAGDRIRFTHIEVPPLERGHGYAEDLTRAGLEYARHARLRVVPLCPFVRTFLAHHPEYVALVDEHWRTHLE